MRLTEKRIGALVVESGGRDRIVFDTVQRGLAVRITAKGSRSYLVQYTLHGQKHRVPLGNSEALSLTKARDAAAAIIGDVAKGRNPAAERRDAALLAKKDRARVTLAQLIDDWQRQHLSNKRPRYGREAPSAVRRAFERQLNRPANELNRDTIKRFVSAVSASVASRTMAYGHALYSWAMKDGVIDSNPFRNLPKPSLRSRERVLSDDELAAIWRATETAPEPFGKVVRVLALTGQRREEVARMGWSELAPDLSTWTIPGARTKNHRTHIVPLSEPVRDIIRSMPRTGALVFPGAAVTKNITADSAGTAEPEQRPFSGWSKSKTRLDVAAGVTGWTLHDLRRTLATGLQRLGVRLEVTEATENHVSGSRGGIVGVYQRHDWANEKRAALDAWATHVLTLADPNRAASENLVRPAFGAQRAA